MPRSPIVTIVDDDPSVCEGLMGLLSSMGFAAEAFERPDEFLKSDRADKTTCLIADVQMPGMSGLELHDRLVRSGKNIPTILITAFPQDTDRGRALRAGVKGYLAKPFSESDLLTCIQSGLESSGAGMHS
jgi:FixJ family two-component response regulator